jgi:hypothetical protein
LLSRLIFISIKPFLYIRLSVSSSSFSYWLCLYYWHCRNIFVSKKQFWKFNSFFPFFVWTSQFSCRLYHYLRKSLYKWWRIFEDIETIYNFNYKRNCYKMAKNHFWPYSTFNGYFRIYFFSCYLGLNLNPKRNQLNLLE